MADIKKKPNLAVSNLSAPARVSGTRKMKATWKIPADMTKAKNTARATSLEIDWFLGIPGKDPKKVTTTKNMSTKESVINLDGLTIGKKTYRRNSFYPLTKTTLSYVTVRVLGRNAKGAGKTATVTTYFKKPRAPSISGISFNTETGVVSATISTNAGADLYERYDTRYKITVQNTRTGKTWNAVDTSTTSTEFTASYNVSDYQQLSYDQFIRVTFEAWSRGYVGDSGHVYSTFYVSYPAQVTIKDVDVSSKDSAGKCTVAISTNTKTEHPVDRVKLEYLANVSYATSDAIPGDASWTASDIIDDASCTALAIGVSNLLPDRGNYTWVRVKSWHASENVLYRYSDCVRVTALETPAPTATDDDIVILSAVSGMDGKSIVVHLGWNADGQDDSTGTELTWADEENTWRSTASPSLYNFEWSDGQYVDGNVTYHDSATITIKGLTEATKYYIKARRYLEAETTTYSEYSNTATAITSETPETIVAICNRYVPKDKALDVYWTFSGNGLQEKWQIVQSVSDESESDSDSESVDYYDYDRTVLASGEGGITSTQISAERLAAFAVDGSITFTVQASTGSGFVVSEEHTVTIMDNPVLALTATGLLTAQPFSFTAAASTVCDLIVILTSEGLSSQYPEGVRAQANGDTIHSGIYSPVWTAGENTYTATVTLPSDLDLWDGGKYMLSVVAVDRTTELRSEEVITEFSVEWAHQAADPDGFVTLTPIDATDAQGYHRMAMQIALTPPTGTNSDDVYDIYRMDIEKASLIGEGFPLTYTAYDEYAPFGDGTLFYRIAIRTVDGDVAFTDVEYTFPGKSMRFDWANGSLELPYNIEIGDTFRKDVEIRQHMNGSSDAYWNENIERASALASDVVRLVQEGDIELSRKLARYAGPVFVRLPNGSAFEADVQVTDLSVKSRNVTAVAIDATEIGLTQEFLLPIPFVLDEEESES